MSALKHMMTPEGRAEHRKECLPPLLRALSDAFEDLSDENCEELFAQLGVAVSKMDSSDARWLRSALAAIDWSERW